MARKLKICGFDFTVVYKDEVLVENVNCLGCCISDTNTIHLKKGMNKSKKHEVILHESIHAMSDIMNLKLSENTVNTLGVVITDFIKKNKVFINKVMED
jgi:hypothetical protein